MNTPIEIAADPKARGAVKPHSIKPHYEALVIGAGVSGIYQLHKLLSMGVDAIAVDSAGGVGGTWYHNRYPGCRFDSESFTYGYSFSREILDEWHWKERFSSQPENLRYLEFVVDRLQLRDHFRFNCRVQRAAYDEQECLWRLQLSTGHHVTCKWLIQCLGLLSAVTRPKFEGMDDFAGPSFHTYDWPHEPLDLAGKRVAVIGTGATGVQVIAALAPIVGQLTVFQRRPNWCAPLNNSEITEEEMRRIRDSYDEIFAKCATTPGGFLHEPDPRSFYSVSPEERRELWERLYGEPGFGIWLQNFREIFTDEEANAEFSAFIADKIRARVDDPEVAEKLIPTDHGWGVQRVPLETRYYEAYNCDHVELVSLLETPVERITEAGIRTSDRDFEFDVIVYATGFDALSGAFERIDTRGRGGVSLKERWAAGPTTLFGMMVDGFPNMILIAGPQSASASVNFPRSIEMGVDWATDLLAHVREHGFEEFEATREAVDAWAEHTTEMFSRTLMHKARNWITGLNTNVEGRDLSKPRVLIYNGGQPRYRKRLQECAETGYAGIEFRREPLRVSAPLRKTV